MKYVNAKKVIPNELLSEIQKYIQGETIYIPKIKSTYQKWGTKSGARDRLNERNENIKDAFLCGQSIASLSAEYYLSPETIKKIVYSKK